MCLFVHKDAKVICKQSCFCVYVNFGVGVTVLIMILISSWQSSGLKHNPVLMRHPESHHGLGGLYLRLMIFNYCSFHACDFSYSAPSDLGCSPNYFP
jgi:hypothetical protein